MPTPFEIISRSIKGQCPRCQSNRIFRSKYRFEECCPDCGLPLEKEDGWSIGAIPLNYTFTCLFWILPVALLFTAGLFNLMVALIISGIGAVVIPFLTYRYSKCLWLACYFIFLKDDI